MTAQAIREARRTLKRNGEVTIQDVTITLDGIGGAEIERNGEFEFSASNWCEVEEYLEELDESEQE